MNSSLYDRWIKSSGVFIKPLRKEITTKRLLLDNARQEDFDGFLRLQTDLRVREFLGGPVEMEKVREKFLSYLSCTEGELHFAVRRDRETLIGFVSLSTNASEDGNEVSYQFLPESWGSGYAFEAVDAVIQFARNELGFLDFIAETQTKNSRSIKLLEKLGMVQIREIEKFGAAQSIFHLGEKR